MEEHCAFSRHFVDENMNVVRLVSISRSNIAGVMIVYILGTQMMHIAPLSGQSVSELASGQLALPSIHIRSFIGITHVARPRGTFNKIPKWQTIQDGCDPYGSYMFLMR